MEKTENMNDDPDVTVEEKDRIRKELSTMSFEDLQKLKEKIGAKVYNETVYGIQKTSKTQFKRTNKNRPREITSKKQVHNMRNTIMMKNVRDPRFDPLCGSYDEKAFKSNYKFLHNMKKEERQRLQSEYENTENAARKDKIKLLMQRLDNQIREQEKRDKQQQQLQTERNEIKQKLKRGERPVFKRKSEKKLDDLVQKYEELKSSNNLQKHIEKRAKKLARKDRKQHKMF